MSKLVGIGVAIIIIFGCASLFAMSMWNSCITQQFESRSSGTSCFSILSFVQFASAGTALGALTLGIGIVRSFLKKKPIEIYQGPTYGDTVGGDKVHGNKVGGDNISTGDISESKNIAIGKGNRVDVNSLSPEFTQRFDILHEIIKNAPIEVRQEALGIVKALNLEIVNGSDANDAQIAKSIEDLVELVPATVGVVMMIFSTPVMKNSMGPVTTYILGKLDSKLRLV